MLRDLGERDLDLWRLERDLDLDLEFFLFIKRKLSLKDSSNCGENCGENIGLDIGVLYLDF